MSDIEARLRRIEEHLGLQPKTPTIHQAPKAEANTSSPSLGVSHLLAAIAVICFVLGGIFIIALAINSGWLNPQRQFGLALILGLTLVVVGRWTEFFDRDYRSYISAAGCAILFVAAYGAHLLYGLTSQVQTLGLVALATLTTILMFHFHKSFVFTMIALLGSYAAPVLLSSRWGVANSWDHSLVFIGLAVLYAWLSHFFESRVISILASFLGIITFSATSFALEHEQFLIVQLSQVLIFTWGVFMYTLRFRTPLTATAAWSYFPVLAIAYATVYLALSKVTPLLAPWFMLGLGATLAFAFYRTRQYLASELHSSGVVQAFLCLIFVHSGYIELLPEGSARSLILPAILIGRLIADQKHNFPRLSWIARATFFLLAISEYVQVCFRLLSHQSHLDLIVVLATAPIAFVSYLRLHQNQKSVEQLFLIGIQTLMMVAIFSIASSYGSFMVTLGWGIYALAFLGFAYSRRDQALAYSSLIVLTFTTFKALVYDTSAADAHVRILCLLATGGVLYGAGFMFKRLSHWKN